MNYFISLIAVFFGVVTSGQRNVSNTPVQIKNEAVVKPSVYTIVTAYDTALHLFKKGDEISISPEQGLYHYRNKIVQDRYKVIAQRKKQQHISPCQKPPCPVRETEVLVYYSELWQRYISIVDLPDRTWFRVTKKVYATDTADIFKEGDWEPWYRMKKIE